MRWSCGARGRVPRCAQRRVSFVLLADPRLVLPPKFYRGARRKPGVDVVQHRRETFFLKSSAGPIPFWSGCCGRAESLRYPSRFNSRPTVVSSIEDAELLEDSTARDPSAPANHAVDSRNRPCLDLATQRQALLRIELRRLARRLAVDQAIRPLGIETAVPSSRTICSPTPPSLAAALRLPPS